MEMVEHMKEEPENFDVDLDEGQVLTRTALPVGNPRRRFHSIDNDAEKNRSEEALKRWRKAAWLVKNRKRRFRHIADLDKRSEAEIQEKIRIALNVRKEALKFIDAAHKLDNNELHEELQDANILQESYPELGEYGLLPDRRHIAKSFANMENMEWLLLCTSIVLEGTSAVFEQLQYPLLGMVMAAVGLLLCLVDLACKLRKEQATFEYKGFPPWFYTTFPTRKLFGSTIEYFGLAAAIWQVFHSTIGYLYDRRNLQNPIRMTIIMFMFCLFQIIAKLNQKSSKPGPPLEEIVVH